MAGRRRHSPLLRAALAALALCACVDLLGDVVIDDTVVAPDAGPPPPSTTTLCEANALRCDGGAVQRCDRGVSWRTLEVCASEALCNPTQGCLEPSCLPNEVRCSQPDTNDPSTRLELCNVSLDGWTTLDVCASPAQCNAELGTCTDAACTPDELACNGRTLQRCNAQALGWDELDACLTAAQCDASATSCTASQVTCAAGETTCSFGRWQHCAPSRDGYVDIEPCVNPGHCVPELGCLNPVCTPAASRCAGAELQRCSVNRNWVSVQACASAAHCKASLATCTEAPCTPGETQCNGSQLERCDAGSGAPTWDPVTVCAAPSLCDPTSGCVTPACDIGEYRCTGENLERCSIYRTHWITVQTCESTALCNASARRCEPPRCAPGSRRCDAEGRLLECGADATTLTVVLECGEVSLCDANAGTCLPPGTACTAESYRCNGQVLERCRGTPPRFRPERVCATAQLCDATRRACADPVCDPGQYRCTPSAGGEPVGENGSYTGQAHELSVCSVGRDGFVRIETCSAEQVCDEAHGQCDDCSGVEACQGDTRGLCSVDGQEFEAEESCAPSGRCVLVQEGNVTSARCEPL